MCYVTQSTCMFILADWFSNYPYILHHKADDFGFRSNVTKSSSNEKSELKSIGRLITNYCIQVLSIYKIFNITNYWDLELQNYFRCRLLSSDYSSVF